MILKSIYLENFRIYKGPLEIQFANGEKGITIIQGTNEVGKTTFMNAITWCLYGNELFRKKGRQELINNVTLANMQSGEEVPVKVILKMVDNFGNNISINRTQNFFLKNEKILTDYPDFSIIKEENGDDKEIKNPDIYIDTHLPSKIRENFLFDGEQLEKYFSETSVHNVKESVFKLSQLNLIKNSKNHLFNVKKDFINELKSLKPKLSELKSRESELTEELEQTENKLRKTENDISKYEKELESLEIRFRNLGDDPAKLLDEEKSINNELELLNREHDRVQSEFSNFLIKNFNYVFSFSLIKNAKSKCEVLEEKGYIPAKYKKEFLEFLLNEEKCICGADLSEGSKAHKKIEQLCAETDEITNISDSVNRFLGEIKQYPSREDINKIQSEIVNIMNNINRLKAKIEIKEEELKNIEIKIQSIDNGDFDLYSDIEKVKELLSSERTNKGFYLSDKTRYEEDLSKVRLKLKKMDSKNKVISQIEKSIKFCEEAISILSMIYDSLNGSIHDRLQKLTSEEFLDTHWKEEYEGITIDDEYNITVHEEGGTKKSPNDLSSGGKLALALSFMNALNALSGFELPILIDTPMSRLDTEIKENIGQYLPNYVKGKQVTFLVTGSEYTNDFKSGIVNNIGKEYKLRRHKPNRGEFTAIEEIR